MANADQWKDGTPGALMTAWLPNDAAMSPNLLNFRHSWEGFIDSLLREWKTQNVVSALMLSAILTMLQIDAAASDPIARTTALLSLISALMSLLFGSMYIVRFGTMRKMYKAASWADEAQKGRAYILWNVWILLAIPAVWLAWSIILFVTCIMAFAWRTGAITDSVDNAISPNAAQGLRVGLSAVLAVALVYLYLILRTFRTYGDAMDRKWNEKVSRWAREGRYAQIQSYPRTWASTSVRSSRHSRSRRRHSFVPADSWSTFGRGRSVNVSPFVPFVPEAAAALDRPFVAPEQQLAPFAAMKIMDLRYHSSRTSPLPSMLQDRDILVADWLRFTGDLEEVWNGVPTDIPPFELEPGGIIGSRERVAGIVHSWNEKFFRARAAEAVLCREQPVFGLPGYAVYLLPLAPDPQASKSVNNFGPLQDGLHSLTVIHLVERTGQGQSSVQYEIGPKGVVPAQGATGEGASKQGSGSEIYLAIPLPPSLPPSPRPVSSPSPARSSDSIPAAPREVPGVLDSRSGSQVVS